MRKRSKNPQHNMVRVSRKTNDALCQYIAVVSSMMGLGSWRIGVQVVSGEDVDYAARITCTHGQRHAIIVFDESTLSLGPVERREVVVHELVHALLGVVDEVIETVGPALGQQAYALFDRAHEIAIEHATDDLARVIAPFMPLPKRWI